MSGSNRLANAARMLSWRPVTIGLLITRGITMDATEVNKASAGAIFQVESMNGVFQGVITPTGPIGWREVMFKCVGVGSDLPSRAPGARSAMPRQLLHNARLRSSSALGWVGSANVGGSIDCKPAKPKPPVSRSS